MTEVFANCAPLTGPPARAIAAELPGEPLVTSLVPAFTKIVSAVLAGWIMIIGVVTFIGWVIRPRFDPGPADGRLIAVDGKARALRWRHRGQRSAHMVAVLAALFLLSALLNHQDGPVALVARLGAFMLLGAIAVGIHVGCRHPATGRPIPIRQRLRIARTSPRRLAGAVAAVLLTVALSTLPVLGILVLMVLGIIVHAPAAHLPEDFARLLFVGLLALMVALAISCDRLARRLRMRNAHEVIDADHRKPILYLRNFGDDRQKLPISALSRSGMWQVSTGWLNPVRRGRFEEILARALFPFGPVIAVDQPNVRFSKLGAAKTRLPHEGWLEQVTTWAMEAHAVVVSATPDELRDGLRSELRMIASALPHGRVVLVLGPRRRKAVLHAAVDRFLREVRDYPLFAELAKWPVADGTLILVHLPQYGWGRWQGWSARRRTAWTYTAAIHEAMSVADSVWQTTAEPSPADDHALSGQPGSLDR
ncbi:hypothetical protein [Micromonospora sp. RP3T]|uniref:hypothetical protein n=1 Tax=Micromonospora sp. RP3T TaxID=2135446 RepID=UPI0011B25971|nr:hypothetical protein [Micromonospora sp. RP3T]